MTKEEYFERIWLESMSQNGGCGRPMLAIIIISIMLLFCSCATKKQIEYVDREVVKYEKLYVHDTTFVDRHDSIYHTVFQKGDTIYDTKYVEKTRWRDRIVERHDTCWRDSISTEYKETVKEVTKIPKIYEISFIFSILCLIFAIIKLVKWLKILP